MAKSFQEMIDLINSAKGDPAVLLPHYDDILEFISGIDSAGSDIMKSKSDQYVGDLYAMISTCALFILLANELCTPMEAIMLSKDKMIQGYAALILKLSIGISAMEELR